MSDVAIRVEGLGKQYRIAHKRPNDTLKEAIMDGVHSLVGRRKSPPAQVASEESFWALKDVSFEVKKGEVLGIIGRNGAGKSTLLKILSRITEMTEGAIDIFGRVGSLLEVGTGFHPELTGRENIYLNGAILGMKQAEVRRRFDEIVAFSEIERFLDTPVKHYSSGMYTRLAFAVAAHLEPEILVVDEVLAVGDAKFQRKCLGKMREASAAHGRTVVFVSHNLAALRSICKKVYRLDKGLRVGGDDPSEVINAYLSENFSRPVRNFDLTAASTKLPQTGFQLTKIEWLNELPLKYGGSVAVRVHYEGHRELDDVSIGIGFSTMDGVRILTLETDNPGQRRPVFAGERGYVELRLESFALGPGFYLLDVGARSGDLIGLKYISGSVQVEVVPSADLQGTLATLRTLPPA